MQPVLFDADAEFEDVVAGGGGGRVPVYDQVGYVQIKLDAARPLSRPQDLRLLFEKMGPIGGPVNCRIRAGRTVEMQLLHLLADLAPNDANAPGFAVAALGLPKLPRAGQWSAVRIDPASSEATPIDARRGVPIARLGAGDYLFREAADIRRVPKTVYGFLMSTDTSRALFPHPRIVVAQPGKLASDKPAARRSVFAVPGVGRVSAGGVRVARARGAGVRRRRTTITGRSRIRNSRSTSRCADLLKGGEWGMSRIYDDASARLLAQRRLSHSRAVGRRGPA